MRRFPAGLEASGAGLARGSLWLGGGRGRTAWFGFSGDGVGVFTAAGIDHSALKIGGTVDAGPVGGRAAAPGQRHPVLVIGLGGKTLRNLHKPTAFRIAGRLKRNDNRAEAR